VLGVLRTAKDNGPNVVLRNQSAHDRSISIEWPAGYRLLASDPDTDPVPTAVLLRQRGKPALHTLSLGLTDLESKGRLTRKGDGNAIDR
jgi:hypothetical protein